MSDSEWNEVFRLSVLSLQRIGYPGNIPGPQHKAGICYLYNSNQTNQSRSPSSSANQHNHLLAAQEEKNDKNKRRNVISSWPEVPAGVRGVRGVSSLLNRWDTSAGGVKAHWASHCWANVGVRRREGRLYRPVSVFSLTLGLIIHLALLLQQTTRRCWEET